MKWMVNFLGTTHPLTGKRKNLIFAKIESNMVWGFDQLVRRRINHDTEFCLS